MNAPDCYFVDEAGNRLPSEEGTDVQHIRQYAGRWRVHVEGKWAGRVVVEHDPLLDLVLVPASVEDWELPQAAGAEVLKGASGLLSVLLLDTSGQIIGSKRVLQIEPANVSWDELEQMLGDIGLMALLSTSCTQADVSTPIQEDIGLASIGLSVGIGHGPLQTASSLIALYEALKYSWSTIQQRPLKSIVSKPGIIRLDKAKSSPMLMIKRKIEPNRMMTMGLTIEEDVDCIENKFLAYLLDHYLVNLAQGIAALLRLAQEQVAQTLSVANLPSASATKTKLRAFTNHARQRVNELSPEYEAYKQSIGRRITQLEAVIKWASAARNSSLLKTVPTPTLLPVASLRLSHSPHYGPVYAKFVQCAATTGGGLEQVLYLYECIQKQSIKPAWNIYELWCVAKLYTTFVTDLQLRPPKGEASLFEKVKFADGEISLPTNIPFRLAGRFGDRNVEVEIWYEKEYRTYGRLTANPDVVIRIGLDGSFSEFCFDAKYRNYSSQGVETFVDDVYTRAYQKYQQQFRFKSGFILHTDKSVDYWGEVKIGDFLNERFHNESPPTTDFAKHCYGAVSLRPGINIDRQFRKLMLLLFQYHGSLQDTCLNCGYRLNPSADMQHDWGNDPKGYNLSDEDVVLDVINNRRDRKGTGIYCSCSRCGNFWVIQRCKGANHPLIKTSPQLCIHRPSARPEHKGKWMYVCPTCGSDPSFSDYANTTGKELTGGWYPEDMDAPPFSPFEWE